MHSITKRDYLHIALATDHRYAEPMETLIKSIILHHKNVMFYLLHNGCFQSNWFEQMNNLLKPTQSEIQSITIITDIFTQHSSQANLPPVSYYRLLIPYLINAERVLYLDADIIVKAPLHEFYHQSFDNKYVVAVKDIAISHPNTNYPNFPKHIRPYFNSGVMLINCQLWRDTQFQSNLEYIINNMKSSPNGDQDILNILLHNKWKEADISYNYQLGIFYTFAEYDLLHKIMATMSCENIKIIHYTTRFKPWSNEPYVLYRNSYIRVRQLNWNGIA